MWMGRFGRLGLIHDLTLLATVFFQAFVLGFPHSEMALLCARAGGADIPRAAMLASIAARAIAKLVFKKLDTALQRIEALRRGAHIPPFLPAIQGRKNVVQQSHETPFVSGWWFRSFPASTAGRLDPCGGFRLMLTRRRLLGFLAASLAFGAQTGRAGAPSAPAPTGECDEVRVEEIRSLLFEISEEAPQNGARRCSGRLPSASGLPVREFREPESGRTSGADD